MDPKQVTLFATMWTKAQPTIFAFVSATITDFNDAEDILQKVAAVAIEKFHQYDTSKPFDNWAIGIARFEVLKYLRKRGSDRHAFTTDSLNRIAEAFATIQPELDSQRHALAHCLKRVNGRSLKILELRYANGLKSGKIASILGISSGNVSVILNRTHRRLRKCIEIQLAAGRSP